MKANRFRFLAPVLLSAGLVGTAPAALVINEILVNPDGGDDNREFVEIFSTTGSDSLAGLWLLEFESNASNVGVVDDAVDLSTATFNAGGYLVLGDGYTNGDAGSNPYGLASGLFGLSGGTIEQEVSFLLVTNFTGAVGNDYDTNDDGVFDSMDWTSVVDSISTANPLESGEFAYGGVFVNQNDDSGNNDAMFRYPNGTGAWTGGEIDSGLNFVTDSNDLTPGFPGGYTLTPGAENVPEPSGTLLLSLSCIGLVWRRRR